MVVISIGFDARCRKSCNSVSPETAQMFHTKKRDLFCLWLENARDIGAVNLQVSRMNIQERSHEVDATYWSRSQLEQSGRYTRDDIDDLIARCTRENRFQDDPNFPGNERLRKYLIVEGVHGCLKNTQQDKQGMEYTGSVSSGEALDLASQSQGPEFAKHCRVF